MVIEIGDERIRTRGEILASLRAATWKSHDRYDIKINLPELVLSKAKYRTHLRRLFGFYAPLEHKLDEIYTRFEKEMPCFGDRRKAADLLLDLVSLGLTRKEVDGTPYCYDLPDVSTPERALGVIYVLEEATVGGQFICQLIHQRLNIPVEEGGRFFLGYGTETGTMWRSYCETLERFIVTKEQREELIQGALDGFAKLQRWIALYDAAKSGLRLVGV